MGERKGAGYMRIMVCVGVLMQSTLVPTICEDSNDSAEEENTISEAKFVINECECARRCNLMQWPEQTIFT